MKANIPTAIRRKMSGRSLLRRVSGSARDQWGGNVYTSAERGGGGGFGTDERPHIFAFFVGKSLLIICKKYHDLTCRELSAKQKCLCKGSCLSSRST